MELLFRAVVPALLTVVLVALLRGTAPGFSLALVLAAAAVLLFALIRAFTDVKEFYLHLLSVTGLAPAYVTPVIKCTAIAAVTRLGSDLCRDGGVGTLAGVIEMAGTVSAFLTSLPLLTAVLEAILDSL